MALANFDIELVKFQRTITLAKSNFIPEYGSEIFVTNLPSYVSDEELVTFFQTAGNVFKIKLMLQDQNKNRGYCYVTYMDPDMARLAVDILNRIPFKGIYLKIKKPLENCRIFLGGIPTDKTKDSVWQELLKIGAKNIVDVIMYRAYDDRAKNRGFVFVQFTTHEEAAYFRAKYYDVLQLWGRKVVIDWSVPLPEVTDDILDKDLIEYISATLDFLKAFDIDVYRAVLLDA
ncbi:probable RNA-binding protein 46 [Diorhabda sublineata]|uniref:probable RNA-binding protein 46 n=1 Tax=Diorhabda sublineata TaxID=1163346 RepID=UPI0024E1648D|nr:probable RNA-binding protein 46 [Diorhabda sublineata]